MDFTPKTKRIIVASIGIVGLCVAIGWSVGTIESKDAMLCLGPIITGFLALLKGGVE